MTGNLFWDLCITIGTAALSAAAGWFARHFGVLIPIPQPTAPPKSEPEKGRQGAD